MKIASFNCQGVKLSLQDVLCADLKAKWAFSIENLTQAISLVFTSNPKISAVKLSITKFTLLFYCVFMPTDYDDSLSLKILLKPVLFLNSRCLILMLQIFYWVT